MKAAEFDYARPGTVEEVCRLLDGASGDGKIIAGGQTLVPLLVMRLTRPSLVIDINRIAALQGIAANDDGIAIKAATRQADVLADGDVQRRQPGRQHARHGHPGRERENDQHRERGQRRDPRAPHVLTSPVLGCA